MGDEFSAAGNQNREPKEARKTQILGVLMTKRRNTRPEPKLQVILDPATPNQGGGVEQHTQAAKQISSLKPTKITLNHGGHRPPSLIFNWNKT
jgi:hypothetical protein